MPLLLGSAEVESLLTMEMAVEACEEAFRALAVDQAINRPRSHTFLPAKRPDAIYMFKSMEGGVVPLGTYALRISSDHLQYVERQGTRRREKLRTLPGGKYLGLILLFSLDDGSLISILPDSYIARMRTGAKNGVGARYLARRESKIMAILGAGWQAGAQLLAHQAVLPLQEVRVFSPTRVNREAFAREMTEKAGIPVIPKGSALEAMKGADVVVTATNAAEPVLRAEGLEPGMHLSHIQGHELDPEVVRRADVVVARAKVSPSIDFYPPSLKGKVGKFLINQSARNDSGEGHDLLEVLRGEFPGRTHDRQITLFGGHDEDGAIQGMLLAATASRVHQRARKEGVGREIPLEWFLEETPP